MSARLLEGKMIADKINASLKREISALKARTKRGITLFSVGANGDHACRVYVKSQARAAQLLGVGYEHYVVGGAMKEDDLLKRIADKNRDSAVTGIMVQVPLPRHIDSAKVQQSIDPVKDVEGIHPDNLGKVLLGEGRLMPPTALACMELIEATGMDLYGKEAVIIGHSNIAGKPLSLMLLNKLATVTVCHVATSEKNNLRRHCERADLLVVAVGKPNLVKGEWIKKGAAVIDVGINRVRGKIVGDVEYAPASKRAGWITPVPGGVGPLTVTMLMRNVVTAARLQIEVK